MAHPIDQTVVSEVSRWVVENGLMTWNWTNGMISKEAAADGLGNLTTTPSFWLGVFDGLRRTQQGLELW